MGSKHSPARWWRDHQAECEAYNAAQPRLLTDMVKGITEGWLEVNVVLHLHHPPRRAMFVIRP